MRADYYFFRNEDGIYDSLVDNINNISEKYPEQIGNVRGQEAENQFDEEVRNCSVKWLTDELNLTQILDQRFKKANAEVFGFDVDWVEEIQYTIYDGDRNQNKSEYYGWHTDNFPLDPRKYDRKLSLVMLLNDPKEYEGGQFQMKIPHSQNNLLEPPEFKNKGDVIIFPSYYEHQVTPVTKGIRKSLVCWCIGPKFR